MATDADGDGLALVSSAQLRGRKLFVWGENTGGHRWQEWLTPSMDGHPRHYAEIQAGLAQTQFEHVPMPAGASWQWVEAYGNAELDPALAAGPWETAVAHGAERVAALISEQALANAMADAGRWADLPPSEFLVAGNGWGALERERRRHAQMEWIDETGTPFGTETLTAAQQPWLELLAKQIGEPFFGAESFVRGADWEELLTAAPSAEAAMHLATMLHAQTPPTAVGMVAVIETYRWALDGSSADEIPLSPWSMAVARRGLGQALLTAGEIEAGLAELEAACALEPDRRELLVEAMACAADNGRPEMVLTLLGQAPERLKAIGRVKFLRARALADLDRDEEAAELLRDGIVVADLREGANSLTDLWRRVCPGEEVPPEYQFSML